MSYNIVKLREIASLIRGITFKPNDECTKNSDQAVACMRTKNIQSELDKNDIIWIPKSIIKNPSKFLQAEDILVSSANSWNLVGKACWVPPLTFTASAGGFISILRGDSSEVDNRYLFYWFTSNRTQTKLRSFSNKTTNISNLDHERTLNLEISLPPLDEQRRIAKILDLVNHQIQKIETQLKKTTQLEKSLYYYYFGDPIINQKNYITSEIRSLCKRLTVGIVVRPSSYYVDNGIPAIRSLNIRKEGLTDAQMVFISEKDNNSIHKKTQLRAGDVISVRSGRPGTSCIVPPSYDGVNSIDILILTPDSRQITSEYLCAFLNSPGGTQIVQKESRGQVQKHLNVKSLSKSKIPIPSIETQSKFKASLYKFNNLKNSLEGKKAQLVALEKSLIDSLLNQQS